MPVTILSVKRPDSIFMNRSSSTRKKQSEYTRKGSWDWTGLSKEEQMAELLEAARQADEDYKNGKCKPVEDLFKRWDEERAGCAATK